MLLCIIVLIKNFLILNMVKNVQVNILNRYLCQLGPYIYYFKSYDHGLNSDIIKQIYEWSNNYPLLNILELDSNDERMFKDKTISREMNKIFLYNDGNLIKEIFNPSTKDIEEIIYLSIILHNKKQDLLAGNVGNGKKKRRYEYQNLNSKNEIAKKNVVPYLKNQINKILRKKIIINENNFIMHSRKDLDIIKTKIDLISNNKNNLKNFKNETAKNINILKYISCEKEVKITKPIRNISNHKPYIPIKPKTNLSNENIFIYNKDGKIPIACINKISILSKEECKKYVPILPIIPQRSKVIRPVENFNKKTVIYKPHLTKCEEKNSVKSNYKPIKNENLNGNRIFLSNCDNDLYIKSNEFQNRGQSSPNNILSSLKNAVWFDDVHINDLPKNIFDD